MHSPLNQYLGLVSIVVRDYDEALAFFVGTLGFRLVEDTFVPEQSKRWVVVSPPGATESQLLLARASTPEQESHIGVQTGGRICSGAQRVSVWHGGSVSRPLR